MFSLLSTSVVCTTYSNKYIEFLATVTTRKPFESDAVLHDKISFPEILAPVRRCMKVYKIMVSIEYTIM